MNTSKNTTICRVCAGTGKGLKRKPCIFCSGRGYYQVKNEEDETYKDPPCGEIVKLDI